MFKLILGFICAFCVSIIDSKPYTCEFGKLYQNRTKRAPSSSSAINSEINIQNQYQDHRLLQTASRSPIRITLDTTNLNSIYSPTKGQSRTTTTKLNFIKKAMLVTQYFYESRLKVSTVSRVFSPDSCHDFGTPPSDQVNGISSSDLHIYVRHLTDKDIGYGATGISCQHVERNSPSLPDPTLQHGRPTVGRIVFNTYTIIDSYDTLTNRIFAQITATSLHQVLHILGFDSSLYGTYLDSSTNDVYAYTPTITATLHATRGTHHLMRTPNVLAWAQEHFDCDSLQGMPLQNQQGTGAAVPSHWQRASIYDELMTGTALGTQKSFTGLTFALLKDMGWYEVDASFSDTTNYGYHMGCSFVNDACHGSNSYDKYFCDTTTYNGVSQCSTTFLGKAICTDQSGIMADGCGIFGQYMSCIDPDMSGDSYKPYTLEQYQTDSFCVQSTLGNVGINEKYRGRCYPFTCYTDQVSFQIGNYFITCTSAQAGQQKTIPSLQGYLQCPDFEQFCNSSRKICDNWCSGNGFCTRGVCNCYPGFYGKDCSKSQCTTGQYWDQKTSACVTECPSGTYQNDYSKACQFCEGCEQCRDQPNICTGCLSTDVNPLYFYQHDAICFSECPQYTYRGGDFCIDCDNSTGVLCQTCSETSTNCTSCYTPAGQDQYFLNTPDFGSCTQQCTFGDYLYYDIVNFQCTITCKDNLKYYPGQCSICPVSATGYCDYCPPGQYKYIPQQDCRGSCPDTYYENDDRHFCQKCDESCFNCDGPYAQNCTQCSQSSSLQYLLLKMCVSSCPRGFYPHDDSGACIVCPSGSNCATCQLDISDNVICLTCKYGYYLQSDDTCAQTCPQYYYTNKWNYTCDQCSPLCGDCTTPSQTSCINCRSSKFFLSNISGGYCLDQCPTELYTESGQNCLDCYQTCLTCDGVNSDDCTSCKQNYFLYNGLCRYVCPAASYPNNETRTCDPCNVNCTFCFGSSVDNCTACAGTLVLDNFTCTATCTGNLTVNQWGVCSQNTIKISLFIAYLAILLIYL